jgi:hypothetical protein
MADEKESEIERIEDVEENSLTTDERRKLERQVLWKLDLWYIY